MSVPETGPRITAVLGPTNTGKTYFAIERMLAHETGMIGFPLRLLARENYDRVVALKGARNVALVTGEEKILPRHARYFICTTESMPLERQVAFLAVDEIQMCADPERGHVFTDRLLRARGTAETLLLGAETVRGVLQALVPGIDFVSRPRLSRLSYTGPKKITRLPPRSAIVAFSAAEVYEIAELIRRQRGGAAVVLGALSPRTRNAQVEMYQAGEVDYLIATDAIGMGLNMNIDHVAFARLGKFDGRVSRRLSAGEIAQIAGRAGRHMSDGTFGTLAELGAMPTEIVEAVESHEFDPVHALQWRNAKLSFSSGHALLKSLERYPDRPQLVRARPANDQIALSQLLADPEVERLATNPASVRLLWDICQIPDFRKTLADAHTRLLARIYGFLMGPGSRLPTDWVADQIGRLDRVDGDIDTLMARIAHVRTWTYVSHRSDWIHDAGDWQARSRALEDRISDALHERLTQRFVDRRTATLARLKDSGRLDASIGKDGDVLVEGEYVGRLSGFRFLPDATETKEGRRTLLSAANRALRGEIERRVNGLATDDGSGFEFDDQGRITWRGEPVARLKPGKIALTPQVESIHSDHLSADQRQRVGDRIAGWLAAEIDARLGAVFGLAKADLSGAARGLAFRLTESLGSLPRRTENSLTRNLTAEDRIKLRKAGVRLGMESIYLPATLKPKAARLRALLWSVFHGHPAWEPPPPGLNSVAAKRGVSSAFYEVCGFRVLGGRAVRVDILDRLAIQLRRASRSEPFSLSPDMVSQIGLSNEQAREIVRALGYRQVETPEGPAFVRRLRGEQRRSGNGASESKKHHQGGAAKSKPTPNGRKLSRTTVDPDSPFAKLRELTGSP